MGRWTGCSLAIDQLTIGYDGREPVLESVSAAFDTGFVAVVGRNGSGKTTLLRAVTGLLAPTSGRVAVLGGDPREDPELRRAIGYLPHRPALLPALDVRANLEYWCRVNAMGRAQRDQAIDDVVERLGLGALLDQMADTLSRGQAQVVGLARALVCQPTILLLDEVTASVDASRAFELRNVLAALTATVRLVVCTTHNATDVDELASDVYVIANGRLSRHEPGLASSMGAVRAVAVVTGDDLGPVAAAAGWEAERRGRTWIVRCPAGLRTGELVRTVVAAGIDVETVREDDWLTTIVDGSAPAKEPVG